MSLRLIRRWTCDRRGVAAVEFALVLPALLALYLGGYEAEQCVSINRKLDLTTSELGNVVSQYTSMQTTDVSTVFNASAQIMAPYSTSNLTIVLSEVQTDTNSNATVTWSQAYGGATALTKQAKVVMPAGLAQPSTTYMLVQTAYAYSPTVGAGFFPKVPLASQLYILPRASASIPCSSC